MRINTTNIKLFYELIQVAVGSRKELAVVPSATDWSLLRVLAEKQAVLGICFYGIKQLSCQQTVNLPTALKMQWLGMTANIMSRNELMDRRCLELQELLDKDGLKYCILKGQANHTFYPSSLSGLRQSGDIDVWVEGGFEKLVAYVNNVAPTREITKHHAHFNVFDDVEVELHFCPLILNNPLKLLRFNRFCKMQIGRCTGNRISLPNGEGKIAVATREFDLVFQMLHIYHHLFTEGIGLRQLLDYFFLIGDANKNEQTAQVLSVVRDLRLDRFASSLMWVLGEVFGLRREQMLWNPNSKDGKFLLKEIMLAGNFGQYDERQRKGMTKWMSFWHGNSKALRLGRFDRWAWFWTPLTRLYWYVWRKRRGYKA